VQKKLAVGASGDRFEREADHVARRAVSGTEGAVYIPPTISALGAQRAPLPPAAKEKPEDSASKKRTPVQRKPASSIPRVDEDKKPGAKAQRDATDGGEAGVAPASVESSIGQMQAGGGNALDGGARSMMESRLAHDFSGVRVHHDSGAARAAQALHSRAFTVGRDVFFNAGEYRPHTTSGRELIAHELTHTVQQAGPGSAVRKKVQRATPPGTGTTPAQQEEKESAAGSVPSTTFASKKLPGATIDATPVAKSHGTITLPVLGLPTIAGALKGTSGGDLTPVAGPDRQVPVAGAQFTLDPVPPRPSTTAADVWTAYARANFKAGVKAKLEEMLKASAGVPNLAVGGGPPVYCLSFRNSKSNVFIGTLDDLSNQDTLLRPQWNKQGSPLSGREAGLHADHILDWQIGGKDAGDNMWLLQGKYNSGVGNTLKTAIDNNLRTVIDEVKSSQVSLTDKPTDVTRTKRQWTLRFTTVAQGSYKDKTEDFWTPKQVSTGVPLEGLKFMTEADLVAAKVPLNEKGIRPNPVKVLPTVGGGAMISINLDPKGKVTGKPRLFHNIWVESGQYNDETTHQAGSTLLTLDVVLFKTEKKTPIAQKNGEIDVLCHPNLGVVGYVSQDSIRAQFAKLDFSPLSPLTMTDVGLDTQGMLVGTGTVLSSKALFPNLDIPLVLYGDRIMLNFPVPTDKLSLGPLAVTDAGLSLGVQAGAGLFVEGYADFVVTSLGSGSLVATVDAGGPRLAGAFNFDTDFFTPAQVNATYDLATDTLTAGGTLGVDKGKIPGVDSGTVTVLVTRDRLDFNGTINLAAPLAGTVINVGYTREQGLRIGADNIPLPFASLPAVQKATMSIAATRTPEGAWSFGGTGTAILAVPGATGTINLVYLDGRITMTTAAAVAKGPASGTLNVTATNAPMDEQGNPVDGPPSGTITVWGRGTVTIRFGNILTGTAGIELTQDNRVILNGTIALPPVFEVFARRDYNKDLLHLEPPEFPIWGVSVAGVGVGVFAFVDARIAFEAYVGAGVFRDAAITAEMDLDHPELATVHGHGEFFVPAYAGLTLDVGGGLRARAAVAYAQGRVGLQGTLGIQADASAGLDVDWNPTSGLAVETRVAANVRPKFQLAANASVTVGVDLLVTDVSHTFGPWQRTLGAFGPEMELGVEFPVRWSEANGLDLSLDNIVIRQPTLDAPGLISSVFDALAP
jgi:hypothetical protein